MLVCDLCGGEVKDFNFTPEGDPICPSCYNKEYGGSNIVRKLVSDEASQQTGMINPYVISDIPTEDIF